MMHEGSDSRLLNTVDGQKYYADDFGQRAERTPKEPSVEHYQLTGKSGFPLMNGVRSKTPQPFHL